MEIVATLGAVGGLAHFLHGRQEQANQDGNDGDDHQQLDEREAPPAAKKKNWHDSTSGRCEYGLGEKHSGW